MRPAKADRAHRAAYVDFGHYQQCARSAQFCHSLATLHVLLPATNATLSAADLRVGWMRKHVAFYKLFYWQQPTIGVCYPRECASHDIEALLSRDHVPIKVTVDARLKDDIQVPPAFRLVAQAVLVTLVILGVLGSLFGWRHLNIAQHAQAVTQPGRAMRFVNSCRVFSMVHTIAVHVFVVVVPSPQLFGEWEGRRLLIVTGLVLHS